MPAPVQTNVKKRNSDYKTLKGAKGQHSDISQKAPIASNEQQLANNLTLEPINMPQKESQLSKEISGSIQSMVSAVQLAEVRSRKIINNL